MARIDLDITLSMVDYGKGENGVSEERGCVENSAHLFFPAASLDYVERQHALNSRQLLTRLRVVYDIWRRQS